MGQENQDTENQEKVDAEITKRINATVNAAVKTHLERRLGQAISDAMVPIQEQLSTLAQAPKQEDEQAAKSGNSDLENQIKALQAQVEKERKASHDERTQRIETARRAELGAALASIGVPTGRIRGAMAEISESVKSNDDGSFSYIDRTDGFDNAMSISEGLKLWSDGEVGKAYIQVEAQGGSGTNYSHRNAPRGSASTAEEREAAENAANAEALASYFSE